MNTFRRDGYDAFPFIAPDLVEQAELVGERLTQAKIAARAERRAEFWRRIEKARKKNSGADDSSGDYFDFDDGLDTNFARADSACADAEKSEEDDSDTTSSKLTVALYSQDQVRQQSDVTYSRIENEVATWLERLENPRHQHAQLRTVNREQVAVARDLRDAFPNMQSVCDTLIGAAVLAEKSGLPLQLPNVLIDGPPGCGKTHLIRQIAEIVNIPLITIPMGSLDGRFELAGGHRTYRSSEPSLLIKRLLQHNVGNAIFLFDEVELARPELYQPLYAFLEDITFRDHYLQIDFNISYANIVLISNDKTLLPDAIRSRVMELDVDEPSQAQKEFIIERIYDALRSGNAAFSVFPNTLPNSIIKRLTSCSLRQARILLETALLRSAAASTNHEDSLQINPDFIVVTAAGKNPIGFIH